VSFLGRELFPRLGAGNRYGLSARGLAVNTATSEPEEFPVSVLLAATAKTRGQTAMTFFALLESQSVVGALQVHRDLLGANHHDGCDHRIVSSAKTYSKLGNRGAGPLCICSG